MEKFVLAKSVQFSRLFTVFSYSNDNMLYTTHRGKTTTTTKNPTVLARANRPIDYLATEVSIINKTFLLKRDSQ